MADRKVYTKIDAPIRVCGVLAEAPEMFYGTYPRCKFAVDHRYHRWDKDQKKQVVTYQRYYLTTWRKNAELMSELDPKVGDEVCVQMAAFYLDTYKSRDGDDKTKLEYVEVLFDGEYYMEHNRRTSNSRPTALFDEEDDLDDLDI